MSTGLTSRTPSSSNTRSSRRSCAMNCVPTTSPTLVSRKAWTISTPCARPSRPSLAASPASRRSGSTFTPTSRCCNASPCRSPSAPCAIPATFHLSDRAYGLNQLRYDLRKLKGHGLIERDGSRYAYRLTAKGVQVALLFLLFHKRLCGPLANSRFHHRPDPQHRPNSRLEAAYHRADKAIEHIVDVLAAA